MTRLLELICLASILLGESCLATKRISVPVDATQRMISNLIVAHTVKGFVRALRPNSARLMVMPKEKPEKNYPPTYIKREPPVEISILPTLRGQFVKGSFKSRLDLGQWSLDLGETTPDRYTAYVESLTPSHKAPSTFFQELRKGSFFAYHLQVDSLYGKSI